MDEEYETEFLTLLNGMTSESLKLERAFIVSLGARPDSAGSPAPASSFPVATS
jgi:hypothetical protein